MSSLAGFYRVKRWEKSIRSASPPPVVERETEARPALDQDPSFSLFFGMPREDENVERRNMSEAEMRLARDLRAAGLI